MQLQLIEEDRLSRLRMPDHGGTELARAQTIVFLPLKIDLRFAAISFNFRFVVCLEKTLPANIKTVGKVSHVHQPFLLKSLSCPRLHQLINLSAIEDRGLASLLCCFDAIEPDQHRPTMHVRALVVEKDRFVSRVGSRTVNFAAQLLTWKITILAEQLRANRGREFLKLIH